MNWLVSFPRSGNTFFRNVIYNVYGIESTTYHLENEYPVDENYKNSFFVKTHLLPSQVEIEKNQKVVYLVRDARDALVSAAHYNIQLNNSQLSFDQNLEEAIVAANGSYFGGWSKNVEDWITHADLIIRFEEFVQNPKLILNRLEKLFPELLDRKPNYSKIPTFQDLKKGSPKYGAGVDHFESKKKIAELADKKFRKGKVGGWVDEIPVDLKDLCWKIHGDTLCKLGYNYINSDYQTQYDIDKYVHPKIYVGQEKSKRNVLIEASKLLLFPGDGIKRYLIEILDQMETQQPLTTFQIDLLVGKKIVPLAGYKTSVQKIITNTDGEGVGDLFTEKKGEYKKSEEEKLQGENYKRNSRIKVPFYAEEYFRVIKYNISSSNRFNKLPKLLAFILSLVYYFPSIRWLVHVVKNPTFISDFIAGKVFHIIKKITGFAIHILKWLAGKSTHLVTKSAVKSVKFMADNSTQLNNDGMKGRMKLPMIMRFAIWLHGLSFRRNSAYLKYDLIHVPLIQNYGPFSWMRNKNKRFIYTMHDMTHRLLSDHHDSTNVALAESGMQFFEEVNAKCISISKATTNDLLKTGMIAERDVKLVYESADKQKFYSVIDESIIGSVKKKYAIDSEKYFMCLSTIEPRKNTANMIKAYCSFKEKHISEDVKLVVCGAKGWKMEDFIKKNNLDVSNVIFTGFVDDKDLPVLFSASYAILYVSHYEGFGLPLLEALTCSTPAIFGNNSSMPEVAGLGGIGVDSNNIEEISDAIDRIYTDDELRDNLAKEAKRNANRFSWKKTARETLLAYEWALSSEELSS